MASGLEPELSVVVDVLFPIKAITEAAKEFREKFSGTPLRLYVEALGAAYQPVLDGVAGLGIVATLDFVILIVRLLSIPVDHSLQENLPLVRAEVVLLLLCLTGITVEFGRRRNQPAKAV